MMIDRRDFIASATLAFVAPAVHLLPSQQPSSAASQSRVVFMIRGWSVQDDRAGANTRTRRVQQYSSLYLVLAWLIFPERKIIKLGWIPGLSRRHWGLHTRGLQLSRQKSLQIQFAFR
jgi:hypothetical protein